MGKTLLSTTIAFPMIAIFAQTAAADTAGLGGGYHGHMYGDGFGFGFMGIGMMVLFWGAIILLAVFAYRSLSDGDNKKSNTSALDILKERLAKGDIEPEEYETRRNTLEG
jgi:putative membrane protein